MRIHRALVVGLAIWCSNAAAEERKSVVPAVTAWQVADPIVCPAAIAFVDPLHGAIAGSDGLAWTDDGGLSWQRADLSALGVTRADHPVFVRRGLGFAVGGRAKDDVLLRTVDDGRSWAQAVLPDTHATGSIWFFDDQHGWLLASRPGGEPVLLETVDAGRTWTALASAPELTIPADRWAPLWFDGEGTCGWLGLCRTRDGGKTWQAAKLPEGASLAREQVLTGDHALVLARRDRRWAMLVTRDGGGSWRESALPTTGDGDVFTFAMAPDNETGWLIGGDGRRLTVPNGWSQWSQPLVMKTSDGGATWERQKVPVRTPLTDVKALSATEAYISTFGGHALPEFVPGSLLHTTDGGDTWREVQPGISSLRGLCFLDARHGWAIGGQGGSQYESPRALYVLNPDARLVRGKPCTGPIPIRVTLPVSAACFTVAINDAQGHRVRNLCGGVPVEACAVDTNNAHRVVEVAWDGRDDEGKLVAPGSYSVLGLAHGGLQAIYEMSFYNPGTPPWPLPDGSGAWLSDHAAPKQVCAASDGMVIAAPFSEGGSGIIAIGPDGRKRWGVGGFTGADPIAADDRYLYGAAATLVRGPQGHHTVQALVRRDLANGNYAPFVLDGRERPTALALTEVLGVPNPGAVTAMAVCSNRLAISLAPPARALPVARNMDLWVMAWLNGAKPRQAWTLDVDDIRFTQSETPQGGHQTELVGPVQENGDFESGQPDCGGYLVKELKVLTASPERPAASGHKFLAMTIDPQPNVPGHRIIKWLGAPDLAKGASFIMTAKVRAKEADGIESASVAVLFKDNDHPELCKQYDSDRVRIGTNGWTEVKLAFTLPTPKPGPDDLQTPLVLVDAQTGVKQKTIGTAPPFHSLAFGRDGTLYGASSNRVMAIDVVTGETRTIATPGLGKPAALTTDAEGNLVVADAGPDSQVKAYDADGKIVYTSGRKGGRPIRGPFDPQAMTHMSSVAVDRHGLIWVTENWDYPRRVSVWGRDGRLVRDYIGNANYAGVGCYLHDQDPTLAYCGPIEMQLDRARRTWKVTQVLWVPDPAAGESFAIPTGDFNCPQRFTSSASGQAHEYLFAHPGQVLVVFMRRADGWQPVAAIGKKSLMLPASRQAGEPDLARSVFWNDANKDGVVQSAECMPADEPLATSCGWGGRMAPDLTIYADGLVAYRPVGFDPDGAPRYGLDGLRTVGVKNAGDLVSVPDEGRLLCLSFTNYPSANWMYGIDTTAGQVQWKYPNPFPGVHGSHVATMSKPGMLIGPLKICGVAHITDEVGSVFMLRGNLGEDYYLTSDGMFVGTMFHDVRAQSGGILPDQDVPGIHLESLSSGESEPFGGWFGKQADGKTRMVCALRARQSGMIAEIKGLETIRRYVGPTVVVTPELLAAARQASVAGAVATAEPKRYTIRKMVAAPRIDADPAKWSTIPAAKVTREGQPAHATIKLAYDDANLYAFFEVSDSSPWRNTGKDAGRIFKTGDAVDLQLSTNPGTQPHQEPRAGDLRLVIGPSGDKSVAVLMAPVDKAAASSLARSYTSPVGSKLFDRVQVLDDVRIAVRVGKAGYCVEAAIPLKTLGFVAKTGASVRGDMGFIASDVQGMSDTARLYWANKDTNLVSDEPLEAWLFPETWGEWVFE